MNQSHRVASIRCRIRFQGPVINKVEIGRNSTKNLVKPEKVVHAALRIINKHVYLFQTKENRYCCHDWTAKFCVLWNVNCSDVRGGKLSDLKQEFGQTIKDREDEVR